MTGYKQDHNKDLATIKPEEWNNIAIPVVDAFKVVIDEMKRLSFNQDIEIRKLHKLEKKEKDNFEKLSRE